MSVLKHRRMAPLAALAAIATLAAETLTGCANPLRLTASNVRYPVSLTDAVYGPDHRLLRDADLVRVREISAEADLCAMERASGEGPLDLSPMLNDLIAQSEGEAVVDFHLALQPPSGEVNFHESDSRCVTVGWTGSVVRRAPNLLALAEVRADCDDHRARACGELARRTLVGEGVEADARAALQLYDGACEGGDAGACAATAAMWREGRHADADAARALTYEQRACELGAVDACGRVGIALADERSTGYDPVRARAALDAPCAADDAPSCTALAGLLLGGRGRRRRRAARLGPLPPVVRARRDGVHARRGDLRRGSQWSARPARGPRALRRRLRSRRCDGVQRGGRDLRARPREPREPDPRAEELRARVSGR